MKARTLLKLATVLSSVLLLGLFVSYRAGAFSWLMATSARPMDSGSGPPAEGNPTGGSTRGDVSHESTTRQKQPPNNADAGRVHTSDEPVGTVETVIAGSKSAIVFRPAPEKPRAQAPGSQPSTHLDPPAPKGTHP
jgi:hypothetical protein